MAKVKKGFLLVWGEMDSRLQGTEDYIEGVFETEEEAVQEGKELMDKYDNVDWISIRDLKEECECYWDCRQEHLKKEILFGEEYEEIIWKPITN